MMSSRRNFAFVDFIISYWECIFSKYGAADHKLLRLNEIVLFFLLKISLDSVSKFKYLAELLMKSCRNIFVTSSLTYVNCTGMVFLQRLHSRIYHLLYLLLICELDFHCTGSLCFLYCLIFVK